ncbi:uncharacterized protein P174DRAFT_426746 [Aspergillus novofumigatus IBT 16806]|uniref:HNH nuclease domain-containing protein n=1 Tax=Aspergillus novofumigatus (strain IBT 16806) TaxID=1392255 RepID=A0A2I1CLF4_ASPN1|nr:uncharacterized protein P174DRAFT_426746 [Aspergillus novofumigatus IBT 16806]PKX98454.1 hypothetical protein P174DRAFT_426746 [Aspergillus novofumigatus IBT 16806]
MPACHLYPYWMTDPNTDGVKQFFSALRQFSSAEKVEAWHKPIYGHVPGIERAANFTLLSPYAHELHTSGYFALEPVEEDPEGKWITVKIWWLKQHTGVDFNIAPQLPPNQHPCNQRRKLVRSSLLSQVCQYVAREGQIPRFDKQQPGLKTSVPSILGQRRKPCSSSETRTLKSSKSMVGTLSKRAKSLRKLLPRHGNSSPRFLQRKNNRDGKSLVTGWKRPLFLSSG